jgi:methylated-DNA-[protein]-cysteine S-methyltransferase
MFETSVAYYESPIGTLEVRGGEKGVCAINFVDTPAPRTTHGVSAARAGVGQLPVAIAVCLTQLDEYFQGRRRTFSVKLDLGGTAFQNKVWRALRAIGFGKTASYKDIARKVGNPAATRAVGGANHRNPVSIIVPCHRVVGSDGRLTGYGGGLWRKEWLLRHEGSSLPSI